MLESKIYEGKNLEELFLKIEVDMNLKKEDLVIKIEEIEGNLFKSKKFILNVNKKSEVISFLKKYIKDFSKLFGLEINSEISFNDKLLSVIMVSDNNSILIGKDGRTLSSLQLIIKQVLRNLLGSEYKFSLDIGGYKTRKVSNLEYEIKNIANSIIKSRIEVKLDPMNSYERRLVHNVIGNYNDLESISEGSEPNRYIIIKIKEN